MDSPQNQQGICFEIFAEAESNTDVQTSFVRTEFMRTSAGVTDHRGNEQRQHLDAGRHGDVEVAQHVLRVLIFGRLAQKGQEPGGFLIGVSHLMSRGKWRGREEQMERGEQRGENEAKGQKRTKERGRRNKGNERRKREVEKEKD